MTVSGTVTYRQRIALAPEAVVNVQLVDVSRQDAPAIVIGEQTIEAPGQAPIPFAIRYDPAAIQPSRRYAIQVRISVDGRLRWSNPEPHSVLTHGNPNSVEVVVEPSP